MSSDPIWSRPSPGERRASLTREQIARVATELVDEHGVAALSMRRIAQSLGVGTMTLYHYVRTKEELLTLIDDAVMGELILDDADLPADDWRTALRALGARSMEVHRRHPWLITALGGLGGRLGPHAMRHFEQSLAAVAGTGLPPEDRLELVSLVDDYVFGHALRSTRGGKEGDEAFVDEFRAFLDSQLGTGSFPHIEALAPPGEDREAAWARFEATEGDDGRFLRGLERLLDGIALDLERRSA